MNHPFSGFLRSMCCVALLCLAGTSFAQTDNAKKAKCAKDEVELVTGNYLPEGFTIVGKAKIARLEHHTQLDRLTEAEKDAMRTEAKREHVCAVFVDFEGLVSVDDQNEGNHETHLFYYTLKYKE